MNSIGEISPEYSAATTDWTEAGATVLNQLTRTHSPHLSCPAPQCQLTHPTQTPLTASRSIQGTFHDSSDYPKLSY